MFYVYCLSIGPPVVAGDRYPEGVRSLNLENRHIVLKYVDESEFSEENFKRNLSDIEWLESNAREHIEVIRTVMEYNTVIPFKFGTIFVTEESLCKFLRDYSASLVESFLQVDGKEEWAVKIYCDRRHLSQRIDEISLDAAALERLIMDSPPGKAFLLKKKKQGLVEEEIDKVCKTFGQAFFNELKSLSESASLNNLLPKEFTGRDENMIVNASFLVKKTQGSLFVKCARLMETKKENSGFFTEVTGPWPPFSFISIKEK
jgi:hypothetical protein